VAASWTEANGPAARGDCSARTDSCMTAARRSRPPQYAHGMWDVLTWHDGTLAIAWWAVIVLVIALLSIGGSAAARRR